MSHRTVTRYNAALWEALHNEGIADGAARRAKRRAELDPTNARKVRYAASTAAEAGRTARIADLASYRYLNAKNRLHNGG